MFYVYALLDPRRPGVFRYGKWVFDHEPFYIGKGTRDRADTHWNIFINHLDDPDYVHRRLNPLKDKRFQHLHRKNLEPIVVIKKRTADEQTAFICEAAMIEKIGRQRYGGPLLNLSAGGTGGGNMEGRTQSESSKRKNSESNKRYAASLTAEQRSEHSRSGWNEKRRKKAGAVNRQNVETFWSGSSDKIAARNAKVSAGTLARYANMSEQELARLRAKQVIGQLTRRLSTKDKAKVKTELKSYVDRSRISSVVRLCDAVRKRFELMVA